MFEENIFAVIYRMDFPSHDLCRVESHISLPGEMF